uniref:Failed axon connections n=1 Tax=Ascaris suum TaxID=6253 RepID=F1L4L5_ASCSU
MPAPPLLKRDWQKDHVYLIQFPRAGCIPSLSPFALKLETWLRMAGIQYSNISNEFKKYSTKRQIPFIEVNGRQIADSNFCIDHLTESFHVDMDSQLSPSEKAQARAFHVLLEESIRWVVVYNRGRNNKFFATPQGFAGHMTGVKKLYFKTVAIEQFKKKIVKACYLQGIGRHSLEEVEKIAMKDLLALSVFLADKSFFFGSKPTSLDATAFGHLTQVYYTPLNSDNLKKYMDEKTPNLVAHINRMKSLYWSDWDDAIRELSLTTHNTPKTTDA